MIRFDNNDVFPEEIAEVYFNDGRVKRMLKSMYKINSAIALPSMVLLIPVSSHMLDVSLE